MTNKKMMNNLRKHAAKSVAGILVAATLMSTAAPAFAEPLQADNTIETEATAPADEVTQAEVSALIDDVSENDDVDQGSEDGQGSEAGQGTETDQGTEEEKAKDVDQDGKEDKDEDKDDVEDKDEDKDNADDKDKDEDKDAEEEKAKDEDKDDVEKTEGEEDAVEVQVIDGANEAVAAEENATAKVSDADKKEIKDKVAEDAKKAEEAKKKAEQQEQEAINNAGKVFADLIIDISQKDLSNPDVVKEELSKLGQKTLSMINEKLLKNIPYAGGFVNEIVSVLLGDSKVDKQDITNQKLDEIIKGIDKLNDTVTISVDKVIAEMKKEDVEKMIAGLNDTFSNFWDTFKRKTNTYNTAVDSMTGTDPNEKGIQDYIEGIYTTTMKGVEVDPASTSYYTDYINFLNAMMDFKTIQGFESKDAFSLFDKVASSQSNYIAKYNDERTNLLTKIQTVSDTGYMELKTAMGLDLTKSINTRNIYQKRVEALRKEIAECDDNEQISKLKEEYDTYTRELMDLNLKIKTTSDNLHTLNQTYEAMLEKASAQKTNIKCDQEEWEAFRKTLPSEVKTAGGSTAQEMDLTTGTTIVNGEKKDVTTHVYPRLSADKSKIEYIDEYNNLIATQNIEKRTEISYSDMNLKRCEALYAIKKGDICTFTRTFPGNPLQEYPENCTGEWKVVNTVPVYMITQKIDVYVDEALEVAIKGNWWDELWNNTSHVIIGHDINTGEVFRYSNASTSGVTWDSIIKHEGFGEIQLVKNNQ